MNRIVIGASLALALLGSTAAFAANTTPASTSTPAASSTPAVDYAARCTSLADQWKTAESSNATNANLGKAKADATKAAKECKSKKTADEKKGVANYEAALKLLGVTPT
jgi:hypothetical protein